MNAEQTDAAWLTIAQTAALLQVSPRTVQRIIAPEAGKDRLAAARFGGCTRIRRSALDRWLAARERATEGALSIR
jgi:excisionase family DNA binding protein